MIEDFITFTKEIITKDLEGRKKNIISGRIGKELYEKEVGIISAYEGMLSDSLDNLYLAFQKSQTKAE